MASMSFLGKMLISTFIYEPSNLTGGLAHWAVSVLICNSKLSPAPQARGHQSVESAVTAVIELCDLIAAYAYFVRGTSCHFRALLRYLTPK